MNSSRKHGPRAITEGRTEALDALRGVALLGVLLVNLLTEFRVPMIAWLTKFHTHSGALNHVADWVVGVGIESKAYAIFALLFGAGIAAQSESGRSTNFFIRRFGVLLVIGLIHFFLFFSGDILTLYAILGLTLCPLRHQRAGWLFVASALMIAVHITAPFLPVPARGVHAQDAIRQAYNAYGNASFPALVVYRLQELRETILPLLVGSIPRTAAMVLLGMASWRIGWMRSPQCHRAILAATAPVLFIVGAAATAVEAYAAVTGMHLGRCGSVVSTLGIVGLALAYATTLLLVATAFSCSRILRAIARLGRMTLTSYLVQTVAFGLIFYGYGLAQYGLWGSAQAALFGVAFYAAQIAFANIWLRYHTHGPVEIVWRRLSYGAR